MSRQNHEVDVNSGISFPTPHNPLHHPPPGAGRLRRFGSTIETNGFALADQVKAKVAAARERTGAMRQSILAQAFSGRLVPNEAELARREGREYEPATVLLERVRAEKEGTQSRLM